MCLLYYELDWLFVGLKEMQIDMASDKVKLMFIIVGRLVLTNLALVLGQSIVGLSVQSLCLMRLLEMLSKQTWKCEFLRTDIAASLS
jgi:hypothetical protein